MYAIRTEKMCRTYKGKGFQVEALKDVTLNVKKGEMVAIVGTSGSGKTTLLNILGLIDVPDSGEYFLNGIRTGECREKELARMRNQNLGFVLQDFALIDRYTAEQNIRVPLMYSNIPKKEWNDRIQYCLEEMGISDRKKHLPSELSGGQKQRVAIARALVTGADIILADEPTGALDSRTSLDIMEVFSRLREEGKTILVVTHDSGIADLCDRIVCIEDGRLA